MGFWKWLKDLFRPLIKDLWAMIKELISGGTELLLAQLKEIAINAVRMVAEDPSLITDSDKRKRAFDTIKTKAIERGLTVKDHLINLSLELALAVIKKRITK